MKTGERPIETARRALLCGLCFMMGTILAGCCNNSAMLSIAFTPGEHPKKKTIDFGKYQEPQLVFEDHALLVTSRFRDSAKTEELSFKDAARIKEGGSPFALKIMFWFSQLEASDGSVANSVQVKTVSATQGGKTSPCKQLTETPETGQKFKAGARRPVDQKQWTGKSTCIEFQCDVRHSDFELRLDYQLHGAGEASPEVKVLELPMESSEFRYWQYNEDFETYMGV